jgi:hypothetical protein
VVGVDKRCFFTIDDGSLLQYSPTIMEKAQHKARWVVHLWTEQPEGLFFVQTDLVRRR